jgi:hypothetical protein
MAKTKLIQSSVARYHVFKETPVGSFVSDTGGIVWMRAELAWINLETGWGRNSTPDSYIKGIILAKGAKFEVTV